MHDNEASPFQEPEFRRDVGLMTLALLGVQLARAIMTPGAAYGLGEIDEAKAWEDLTDHLQRELAPNWFESLQTAARWMGGEPFAGLDAPEAWKAIGNATFQVERALLRRLHTEKAPEVDAFDGAASEAIHEMVSEALRHLKFKSN